MVKKKNELSEKLIAQGYSDEDSEVIVGELQKLAQHFAVDGYEDLPPKEVMQLLRAEPEHPLHRFVDWDVEKAAEANFVQQVRKLIRSVKLVTLELKPLGPVEMKIVQINTTRLPQRPAWASNGKSYNNPGNGDPRYQQQVKLAFNSTKNAANHLMAIAGAQPDKMWPELKQLVSALRDAIATYEQRDVEHAAEE